MHGLLIMRWRGGVQWPKCEFESGNVTHSLLGIIDGTFIDRFGEATFSNLLQARPHYPAPIPFPPRARTLHAVPVSRSLCAVCCAVCYGHVLCMYMHPAHGCKAGTRASGVTAARCRCGFTFSILLLCVSHTVSWARHH